MKNTVTRSVYNDKLVGIFFFVFIFFFLSVPSPSSFSREGGGRSDYFRCTVPLCTMYSAKRAYNFNVIIIIIIIIIIIRDGTNMVFSRAEANKPDTVIADVHTHTIFCVRVQKPCTRLSIRVYIFSFFFFFRFLRYP
jgi:hypothetical protein